MTTKLHLQLKPTKSAYRLVWTEVRGSWSCGPLSVWPFLWSENKRVWLWGVFWGVELICRPYGYTTARAAMAAAPHLGPVRRLMATTKEQNRATT